MDKCSPVLYSNSLAYLPNLNLLLFLEPFLKLGWVVVVVMGGGRKTFHGSAMVLTLDLRLRTGAKLIRYGCTH